MELRAALVGCGAMSEVWLEAVAKVPDIRIVGLADIDAERADPRRGIFRSGRRHHRRRPCAYRRQPTRPDLGSTSSCPRLATASLRRALRRAATCSSEKPMAETLGERARPVARAQDRRAHPRRRAESSLPRRRAPDRARCARPARSATSPACTPISSLRRISAAFARRWTMCCCSTWRSTPSTRCAA